jgi:hypothetical protein
MFNFVLESSSKIMNAVDMQRLAAGYAARKQRMMSAKWNSLMKIYHS